MFDIASLALVDPLSSDNSSDMIAHPWTRCHQVRCCVGVFFLSAIVIESRQTMEHDRGFETGCVLLVAPPVVSTSRRGRKRKVKMVWEADGDAPQHTSKKS